MSINFLAGLTENISLSSANGANRDFSGDFAIFIWFNCTDKTQDVQFRVLWNNGGSSAPADYMQIYVNSTTGVLIFLTADTDRITGTTDVSDGIFRTVLLKRVGTTISMEINGIPEGGTFTSSQDFTHTLLNFYIGVYGATLTTGRWVGKVSEFAIWSGTLTENDSKNLQSRVKGMPLQINPSALRVYLPMDDFPNGATVTGTNTITNRSSKIDPGTPSGSPLAVAEEVLSYV